MGRTYYEALLSLPDLFQVRGVVGRRFDSPSWLPRGQYTRRLTDIIEREQPNLIIICVSENSLLNVLKEISFFNGIVIAEKPIGRSVDELSEIVALIKATGLKLRVAVNRRAYDVIQEVRARLKTEPYAHFIVYDQQGPSDFTESRLEAVGYKNILMANSIHLIDSLVYMAGSKNPFVSDKVLVSNAGLYQNKISLKQGFVADYFLAWKMPGPWAIKVYTKDYYYELSPIEVLKIKNINRKVVAEQIENQEFKAGIVNVLKTSIDWWRGSTDFSCLPTLDDYSISAQLLSSSFEVVDKL